MELRSIIRKLIFEVFNENNIDEVRLTKHLVRDRLDQRFFKSTPMGVGYQRGFKDYVEVGHKFMTDSEKDELRKKIDIIGDYNFPMNKTYAVKLLRVVIDPNSVTYYPGYSQKDVKDKDLIYIEKNLDGYGDTVYGIIRENELVTAIWVRSYRKITPDTLRVDVIVNDFGKILRREIY